MKVRGRLVKRVDKWVEELRREGLDGEEAELLERFVEGGMEALTRAGERRGWVQVGLRLDFLAMHWPLLLTGDLVDRVEEWMETGAVQACWFVYKPPGMRLRVLGERPKERLAELLEHLREQGDLGDWSWGWYEPETYLFGGERGLELAHAAFTADTLAVLGYHRARLRASTQVSPELWSMLLTGRIWTRAAGDRFEMWDVCRRLEAAGRLLKSEDNPPGLGDEAESLVRALRCPDEEAGKLDAVCAALFDAYAQRMDPVVEALVEAGQQGQLLRGVRGTLPFWLVFHWNRMRFDLPSQRRLAACMERGLSPNG